MCPKQTKKGVLERKKFKHMREQKKIFLRPQVGREHPLNLSISLSGGKENKGDSLSNGERTGK
jgi:hypothetical protein